MFCLKATENCLVMSHPRSLSPCGRQTAIRVYVPDKIKREVRGTTTLTQGASRFRNPSRIRR
jgi:hypothetical protein